MTQAVNRGPVTRTLPSPTVVVFALMLGLTITGFAWMAAALSDPAALPIRKVAVEGEFTHLDPDVLQDVVAGAVDAGFFGVDVAKIRRHLLDEPWIREATIRRVWPDSLHVRVVEQTPFARWGEQAMLNEVGDIFAPAAEFIPVNLVRLHGPLGSEIEVLNQFIYVASELAGIEIDIATLTLSARYAWTVTTMDATEIVLGRKDLRRRLKRFLFGYTHGLAESWSRIGRVDLRYTNGFAVSQRGVDSGNG